jgi:biotin transporter BioY
MWYEIAILSMIFAVGNILFGHFEEQTPKWRKLLKFVLFLVVFLLISYFAGRNWFHISLCIATIFPLVVHVWWLPKKGINGWTGEPKDKYYELRGCKKKDQ